MTVKKYIGCSVEDLLHDQKFVSDIREINTSEEWEQFLQAHIESKNNILQARKIIQLFQTKEGVISEEKRQKLWGNIYKYNVKSSKNSKLIKIRAFSRVAAAVLILISVSGLLYVHFNKIENPYQFSELGNDLKTETPLLVLSNGNMIELEKTESKIIVLKGQNAIQINNDKIVENQTTIDKTTQESKFNEVIIPFGKKSKLILEDGTTVWLNAGSRFAFPPKFNEKERRVFLEGEAYFEVAKNDKKPFIVSTDDINIEVLGTKFNVSAYHSDNLNETVLLEGRVNIWDNGKFFKDRISMVPNQKATYNKAGKNIALIPEPDPEKYIVWVEGWYQFANEDLDQVLKKLERYYNVKFEYNQSVKSEVLPVSGKLDLKESLNEVLVVLSRVTKFDYQISGNIVIIENQIKK